MNYESRELSEFQRVDAICERFEAAWQSGDRPRLSQFLATKIVANRDELFRQLLKIDLDYRSIAQETPTVGSYLDEFKEFRNTIQREFERRFRTEETPSVLSAEQSTHASHNPLLLQHERNAPEKLGRYIVLEKLGQGGFGSVYAALDSELNRKVAIKITRPELQGDEEATQLALSEARTIAELDHPNIAPIYDVGRTLEGEVYFVMKYFPQGDFAHLCRSDQNIEPLELARLFANLADGLAAAHERGIIHRDIKPHNILVGHDGELCLVDFGLAARMGSDADFRDVAGTPRYMSPEQVDDNVTIDHRTDLFSLGVVLYEALTHCHPFPMRRFVSKSSTEFGEPESASFAKQDASSELEPICLKMLAVDRTARYANATEIADDLRAVIHPKYARYVKAAVMTALVLALLTIGLARWKANSDERRFTDSLIVSHLIDCELPEVPAAIDAAVARPNLRLKLEQLLSANSGAASVRAELALLRRYELQTPTVSIESLRTASPRLAEVIAAQLDLAGTNAEAIWTRSKGTPEFSLGTAAALAKLDPANAQWQDQEAKLVAALVRSDNTTEWAPLLKPIAGRLSRPLLHIIAQDNDATKETLDAETRIALLALICCNSRQPDDVVNALSLSANPSEFQIALNVMKTTDGPWLELANAFATSAPESGGASFGMRRANAALFSMLHGQILPNGILKRRRDDDVRSWIVCKSSEYGVPLRTIVEQYHQSDDAETRRALIWATGEFDELKHSFDALPQWIDELKHVFHHETNSGIHGAAEHALRRLTSRREVDEMIQQMPRTSFLRDRQPDDRQWFINAERYTMIQVRAGDFTAGTRTVLEGKSREVDVHQDHVFAIAAKEATFEQWDRFTDADPAVQYRFFTEIPRTIDSAACVMNWHEAAAYCNWLSSRDGIPTSEYCYERSDDIDGQLRMRTMENYRARKGYRLPSEAEWEYACRAGSFSAYSYGEDSTNSLHDYYAITSRNCQRRAWPVAMRVPNDFGLFDMHGSQSEWTDRTDRFFYEDNMPTHRALRGGNLTGPASIATSCVRGFLTAETKSPVAGVRVVRTMKPASDG